ncbi:MAG: hypothetical protein NTY38_01280 [Acidobacteria bacterium]|nr:hypothetical protein [Acidobacteriota bacterium]
MRIGLLLLLAFSLRSAIACEFVLPSPKAEAKHAEIEGQVSERFSMHRLVLDGDCVDGFRRGLVKVGSELIVYAWRASYFAGGFLTNTCSRTALTENASLDLKQLGRGHGPSQ